MDSNKQSERIGVGVLLWDFESVNYVHAKLKLKYQLTIHVNINVCKTLVPPFQTYKE